MINIIICINITNFRCLYINGEQSYLYLNLKHTTLLPFYFKVMRLCVHTSNIVIYCKIHCSYKCKLCKVGPTMASNCFHNGYYLIYDKVTTSTSKFLCGDKTHVIVRGPGVRQRKIGILLRACDTIELYCFCYSSSLTVFI